MAIAISLPQLLFGLLAGVFVDRWNRKRIMIISDLVRGLLVLGFIVVREPDQVWILYVLGFLQAAVGTFFEPAKGALIPALVHDQALLSANALSQTTRVVTGVVGSALAGVLIGVAGSGWPAFTLDALSFFVSAGFIARVSVRGTSAGVGGDGSARQALRQLMDGLRFLVAQRLLMTVLVVLSVAMLGIGAVNVLFVPFLVDVLGVPVVALGAVDGAQVAGMVLGSGFVAALATRLKTTQIVVAGISAIGILMAIIGAAPNVWIVLIALFLLGLCLTPLQAAVSTLMQRTVPDDKRGRAGSALNTAMTLASVISMAAAGVLGETIGIRSVFYAAGGLAVVSGLLALLIMPAPAPQPEGDRLPRPEV
jgi:MFS family permease